MSNTSLFFLVVVSSVAVIAHSWAILALVDVAQRSDVIALHRVILSHLLSPFRFRLALIGHL
jgi:hypothetical protein